MRTRPPQVSLLGLAVMLSITGCANSEAGFGLPVLDAKDAASVIGAGNAEPGALRGHLMVERNGCFTWRAAEAAAAEDSAWIVWPDDARQDGGEVILGSGARVGDREALQAVGAVLALADLPEGTNPDSYFSSFGQFCGADVRGVVVLTEVSTD